MRNESESVEKLIAKMFREEKVAGMKNCNDDHR